MKQSLIRLGQSLWAPRRLFETLATETPRADVAPALSAAVALALAGSFVGRSFFADGTDATEIVIWFFLPPLSALISVLLLAGWYRLLELYLGTVDRLLGLGHPAERWRRLATWSSVPLIVLGLAETALHFATVAVGHLLQPAILALLALWWGGLLTIGWARFSGLGWQSGLKVACLPELLLLATLAYFYLR